MYIYTYIYIYIHNIFTHILLDRCGCLVDHKNVVDCNSKNVVAPRGWHCEACGCATLLASVLSLLSEHALRSSSEVATHSGLLELNDPTSYIELSTFILTPMLLFTNIPMLPGIKTIFPMETLPSAENMQHSVMSGSQVRLTRDEYTRS